MKKPLFRLALVTGASSGIGEALCHLLADKGIDLIITGRNEAHLQHVANDLRHQVKTLVIPADLNNPTDKTLLIKKIHELAPDLVINNAGFGLYGEALTFTTNAQVEIVNVNINALVEITLEAARTMVSNKQQGVILNVSSAAAFQSFPGFATYCASKAFVNRFSESIDEELKAQGVRVLTSCPGQVATKFRLRASQGSEPNQKIEHAMSATFAAEQIWKQIERKKPISIFNWKYRLGAFLAQYLMPKCLLMPLLHREIQKRSPNRSIIQINDRFQNHMK